MAGEWLKYGLTEAQYRYRKRKGIPFDAPLPHKQGRKRSKTNEDMLVEQMIQDARINGEIYRGKKNMRYSGKSYKNTPEKIEAIKEKYKNGVTKDMIADWINNL